MWAVALTERSKYVTEFTNLNLIAPLQRALAEEGYATPTAIQTKAIPHLLEGRDLLGLAQTGTGKTAAFALPLLQRLAATQTHAAPGSARALILTPTRELAVQIGQSIRTYGRYLKLRSTLVFGGVGQGPQVQAMARGVDVLIATPGRLLDLMNQRRINLRSVEVLILDEADRMLDLGFIVPIRKIVATLPAVRQTALFSATMPKDIAELAASVQRDPVRVEAAPVASTAERVEQRVLFVEKDDKKPLLCGLLADRVFKRTLVFTRTKRGADRVAQLLAKSGVTVGAIHGDKGQGARQAALEGFRAGRVRVLVATDIAARGIDVDGISHVINYELPDTPESYVHRIGRTARAGSAGIALSFCDEGETPLLRDIEKLTRQTIQADESQPFHAPRVARLREGKRPSVAKPKQGNRRPFNRGFRKAA
jgi:ATP-dependent RNA helicase RhlE